MNTLAEGKRRAHTRSWLVALLLLGACGGDEPPESDGDDIGGDGDDAGMLPDDPNPPLDDGGLSKPLACAVDPTQLRVDIDAQGSHAWDALQVGDTIHLAYQVVQCAEDPAAEAQRLDYLTFASTGAFGTPIPVVGAGDTCSHARAPALAPGADEPFLLYTSNTSGTSELFQKRVGQPDQGERLTVDAAESSDLEEHTIAVPFGATNLLAYVNAAEPLSGPAPGQVVTRRAGLDEQEIVPASRGLHIRGLAMAAFPDENEHGGMIVWVADLGPTPEVAAQLLDKSGKPVGQPVVLTDEVSALSNVSILMLPQGSDPDMAGAIAYATGSSPTQTSLRLRTIGHDGKIGDEQLVTSGAIHATGIGMAYYASGYALVYRVVAGEQTTLHVKVVDVLGNTAPYGELILTDAAVAGGPAKAFVTSDGRLTVAFTDETPSGTTLRVVRAICDY